MKEAIDVNMRAVRYLLMNYILLTVFLSGVLLCPVKAETSVLTDQQLRERLKECRLSTRSERIIGMTDTLMHQARERGNMEVASGALLALGEYYYNKSDLDKMKEVKLRLEKEYSGTPYEDSIFSLWNRIIDCHLQQMNYPQALVEIREYQQEALRLKNSYGQGYAYQKNGDIYFYHKDFKLAIEQYKKGLSYFERKKINKYRPEFYLYISSAYFNLDDYTQCKTYLQKLLDETSRRIPSAIAMMALCNAKQGLMDETEQNLMELEDMMERFPFSASSLNNYNIASCLYHLSRKEYPLALEHAQQIKNIRLRKTYLVEVYKAEGNYKEALHWAEKYIHTQDSISNQESSAQLAQYAAQYDADRLRDERNLSELERKNIVRNICIVAVLVGLLLVWWQRIMLHREHRQKQLAVQARIETEEAMKMAEAAQREAEKADHLKSQFLQNMSHEIRTPLNAIVGFSSLLFEDEMEFTAEEKRQYKELVESNSKMLTTLINDILDISKLESGTYKLDMAEVSVKDLCLNALNSVEGNQHAGVEMRVQMPDDTLLIKTDAMRTRQVLINFLTNACKYTESGHITLAYFVRQSRELPDAARELVFAVEDTGCGIPEEYADKVFERFEKLDSFKQGSGLGLNICSKIARLLNGKVMLDTSYKEGSRFLFILPVESVLSEKAEYDR